MANTLNSPVCWAVLLGAALLGVACSSPRIQTTRLGSGDLIVMTDRMAESILRDERVAGRGPDDEPWIITMDQVRNRTNEIIPERERWAFVARLRAALSASEALAGRNLRFVVPAAAQGAAAELDPAPERETAAGRSHPTHVLTATFHALTTRTRAARSDTYLCAFQLMDLETDAVVWEERYEVKRAVVRGRLD